MSRTTKLTDTNGIEPLFAECLSSNNVNFCSYLQKCQKILFAEQYPDDYNALTKKLADSYSKKEMKLKQQLEELNNDNTEEA